MSTILHNDTITTTGSVVPATVDASPFVLDLGPGLFTGRIEWDVESADAGGTLYASNVQGSADGLDPFFGMGSNPNIPPGTLDEVLPTTFNNQVWTGTLAGGIVRFIRASFLLFGGGSTELKIVVTLLDEIDVIPQTFPTPTAEANAYLSIPDLLLLLPNISPLLLSFIALAADRQADIWVRATSRIEQEVIKLCQPKGSSLVDPDTQTLLWGRLNAFSALGPIIATVLPSWIEAIALYADEIAKAETAGLFADEPSEDRGVIEVEVGPEQADYRRRYNTEGFSGNFFEAPGRAAILALLRESFPHGGAT